MKWEQEKKNSAIINKQQFTTKIQVINHILWFVVQCLVLSAYRKSTELNRSIDKNDELHICFTFHKLMQLYLLNGHICYKTLVLQIQYTDLFKRTFSFEERLKRRTHTRRLRYRVAIEKRDRVRSSLAEQKTFELTSAFSVFNLPLANSKNFDNFFL